MKVLLPVLLLFLSLSAAGQSVKAKIAKFSQAKYYSADYDPTTKVTTVKSPPGSVVRSNDIAFRTMTIWMELRFPGVEPKGNATLDLVLESSTSAEEYLKDHHLSFLVDGKTLDIGDGTRTSRRGYLTDYVETMTYRLTADQIRELAKAKAISIHIARFEGPLKDETVTTVRNMISLMN